MTLSFRLKRGSPRYDLIQGEEKCGKVSVGNTSSPKIPKQYLPGGLIRPCFLAKFKLSVLPFFGIGTLDKSEDSERQPFFKVKCATLPPTRPSCSLRTESATEE